MRYQLAEKDWEKVETVSVLWRTLRSPINVRMTSFFGQKKHKNPEIGSKGGLKLTFLENSTNID